MSQASPSQAYRGLPIPATYLDELSLWSAPFALTLLECVPFSSRESVYLDLACGTGAIALELADRCGRSSRIVAIDSWANAIERLREKAVFRGLSNLDAVVGDALRLPVRTGSVDVLTCNLGLNNFSNPAEAVRECRRVCAADASVIFTTNIVGHMAEFYDVLRAVLANYDFADPMIEAALEAHIAHRGNTESVESLFTEAGFVVQRKIEREFVLRFATASAFFDHSLVKLGFLPAWREALGPNADAILRGVCDELDRASAVHGELRMTVPSLCIVARPTTGDRAA